MKKIKVSRRGFLSTGVLASGLGSMRIPGIARAEAACVLTAEQEVGPFYLDQAAMRKVIREDRPGIPLSLRIVVQDSRTCTPLAGAAIDIWHCDAMGLYSGFTKVSLGPPPEGGQGRGRDGQRPDGPPPGGPPPGGQPPPGGEAMGGPPAMRATDSLRFLRGIQLTNKEGAVDFETIFPGFYDGRTNHVHFKVRLAGDRQGDLYAGGHTSHTGQVFFPEDWNVKLMADPRYAAHQIHRTTMGEDGIFNGQHGSMSVATLLPVDASKPEKGLRAQLLVAVDPTATPKPVGMGGPAPRG